MFKKLQNIKKTYDLIKNVQLTKSTDQVVRERAYSAIENLIGEEKGLLLKIAQFASSKNNLPEKFTEKILHDLPPLPWAQISKILETEFEKPLSEIFEWIEPVGIPASLSQVHKAKLISGQIVAIKIKYPEIAEAISDQLALLNLIPGVGPVSKWGIPIEEYKVELTNTLNSELDYAKEVECLGHLKLMQSDQVLVPQVFPEYCTQNLIVLEWIEGESLTKTISSTTARTKERLSELILSEFFKQVFVYNYFQSDFNLGNFLVHNTDNNIKLALLDFGSFLPISKTTSSALEKLIYSKIDNQKIDNIQLLEELGFDRKKITQISNLVDPIIDVLLKPFSLNAPFDTQTWEINKNIDLIAGELKWWFRSAGSPHFFHFVRAYVLVISLLNKLNTPINWQKIFLSLQLNQKTIVGSHSNKEIEKSRSEYLSEKIVIHVTENEEDLVKISLPINAIEDLADLIPEDTREKIKSENVDIDQIIHNCIKNKAPKGLLFSSTNQNKKIEIRLE